MIVVNARFLTQQVTGVQRFSIELSIRLKRIFGSEISFVAPQNIIQEDIAEELSVIKVGTHIGHFWEQWDLPNYLNRVGKPLLINWGNTGPVMYNNKVTTLHDITFIRYPRTFSFKFRLLYKLLIPQVIRTSKHLFTVSEFSKKEIAGYYNLPLNKISVIYNAVSDNFHPTRDENLVSDKYLLVVSSVKDNKNFLEALDSFLLLSERVPELKMYVIGETKSRSFNDMDLSLYKKESRIKFLGRVSDVQLVKLYSNACAFIFPSFYEGFGIPVLEAQACGCPVISSNTSSLPEVLLDSAILCEPTDIQGMAKSMVTLVKEENMRNEYIRKGFINVARFDWESSCKMISDKLKCFAIS